MCFLSRTTWVSQYQKGKVTLDLDEARGDEVLGCSGISWTICKQSAPCSRQPHQHFITQIFTGRMLFLVPNQQCQSTEGKLSAAIAELLVIFGRRSAPYHTGEATMLPQTSKSTEEGITHPHVLSPQHNWHLDVRSGFKNIITWQPQQWKKFLQPHAVSCTMWPVVSQHWRQSIQLRHIITNITAKSVNTSTTQ